mgnify:CR=1 FL=1
MRRFLKYFVTPVRRGRLYELLGADQADRVVSELLGDELIWQARGQFSVTAAGLRSYTQWLAELKE